MRIMLVNPPLLRGTMRRIGPVAASLFYNSAPLGLCYLAAVMERQRHEVRIVDAPAEGIGIEETRERIRGFRPDAVGITTYTASAYSAYELARRVRNDLPQARLIAGGDHITSNPHDLLGQPAFDAAVIGEGEVTFRELIEAWQDGGPIEGVKGIAFRAGTGLVLTPDREYIQDLDTLPFPARHLVPMRKYRPQPNDHRRLPKVSMISSRGCPYPCIFCDKNVFKNRYRSFSPGYIVAEMALLAGEFKARDIAFVDSTFTPDKERVRAVVRRIKEAGIGVTWTCSARADVLDRELMREMKEAGCWRIRLGIESGNEEILRFIKKGATKYQITRVAEWAYELGLEPKGFFMVGHLPDTRETIEESIRFACSLPLKDITVQINTPLKNTPQYGLVEAYGKLTTTDISRFSFWEPVFLPRGLSGKELYSYYAAFYLKFYSRPRLWWRHLKDIRSLEDIARYLRGARILFFFLLSWLKKGS